MLRTYQLNPKDLDIYQEKGEQRGFVTVNAPFGTSNLKMDYSTSLRPNTKLKVLSTSESEITKVPAGVSCYPGFRQMLLESQSKDQRVRPSRWSETSQR